VAVAVGVALAVALAVAVAVALAVALAVRGRCRLQPSLCAVQFAVAVVAVRSAPVVPFHRRTFSPPPQPAPAPGWSCRCRFQFHSSFGPP